MILWAKFSALRRGSSLRAAHQPRMGMARFPDMFSKPMNTGFVAAPPFGNGRRCLMVF
jgi:hypothetical protein